jgi:hypothetical protein
MPATAEQQQLTEALLDSVQRTDFSNAAQLDRIERLISTRDELETYIAILIQKVEQAKFPGNHILDRLERLLRVLQRFDEESGGKG